MVEAMNLVGMTQIGEIVAIGQDLDGGVVAGAIGTTTMAAMMRTTMTRMVAAVEDVVVLDEVAAGIAGTAKSRRGGQSFALCR